MIKISVIMPMYNVEHFVGECIESILSQTMEEWELICVNDGSKDRSPQIAEEYAVKDRRIKIIHKENGGLSSARNLGMEYAKGEYLLFLDSDDYLAPEALEKLYTRASVDQLEELFYSADVFFEGETEDSQKKSYAHYYQRKGNYEGVWNGRKLFEKMSLNQEFRPSACLQIFFRQFLEKNGIRFYEGILHEDNLFTLQCLALAVRTGYLNEELYMRRVRQDSIMTQKKSFRNVYGYFITVTEMIEFAEKHLLQEDEEYFDILKKRLCILCDSAAGLLEKIDESEMDQEIQKLNAKQQALFATLILNDYEIRKRTRISVENRMDRRIEAERKKTEEEIAKRKREEDRFCAEKEKRKKEKDSLKSERERLKKEVNVLKAEKEALINSTSYKVGRAITWLPRKVKGC